MDSTDAFMYLCYFCLLFIALLLIATWVKNTGRWADSHGSHGNRINPQTQQTLQRACERVNHLLI